MLRDGSCYQDLGLNTSLAVIQPKPRPGSPTTSEISVIMLKSELPHEARIRF
jgi:hypothetical protein